MAGDMRGLVSMHFACDASPVSSQHDPFSYLGLFTCESLCGLGEWGQLELGVRSLCFQLRVSLYLGDSVHVCVRKTKQCADLSGIVCLEKSSLERAQSLLFLFFRHCQGHR